MLKVLLVDDNESIIDVCTRILKSKFDVTIVSASSGKEAIALLKKDQSFDVIISDYNMPNGNGLELLKFKLSQNLIMPFYFYTDEVGPEIPYSPNSFLGIFTKGQFEQLCNSIALLLKS